MTVKYYAILTNQGAARLANATIAYYREGDR